MRERGNQSGNHNRGSNQRGIGISFDSSQILNSNNNNNDGNSHNSHVNFTMTQSAARSSPGANPIYRSNINQAQYHQQNQLQQSQLELQQQQQQNNMAVPLLELVKSYDPESWTRFNGLMGAKIPNNYYSDAYNLIIDHHMTVRSKLLQITHHSKEIYQKTYKSLEMDRITILKLQTSIDEKRKTLNDNVEANTEMITADFKKMTNLLRFQKIKTRRLEIELDRMRAIKSQYSLVFMRLYNEFRFKIKDSCFFNEENLLTLKTILDNSASRCLMVLSFLDSLNPENLTQLDDCQQIFNSALVNYFGEKLKPDGTLNLPQFNISMKNNGNFKILQSELYLQQQNYVQEQIPGYHSLTGNLQPILPHAQQNMTSYEYVDQWIPHESSINIPTPNIKNSIFPLNKLPEEILENVLEKLDSKTTQLQLMRVCKTWAYIICSLLYYRPPVTHPRSLEKLTQIMIQSNKGATVLNYNHFIKRLNFSFVTQFLKNSDLLNFANCPNLERLTLVFCKNIDSIVVSKVLKGCKMLQSVDLTGTKSIDDSIFRTLAEECPRLQGFYAPNSKNVSLNSITTFVSQAFFLKRLKITGSSVLNDHVLKLLAKTCPLIVELDITESENVTDAGLIDLFTNLSVLREFRLTHNKSITDNFSNTILLTMESLNNLRLLELTSCENISDKTVENFVAMAPKLRQVLFGKCGRLTDASLFHFSKLGKNLQTLHMGHCIHVTDKGVLKLIESCSRLQYLDFACCVELTNKSLIGFGKLTKLKRIGLVKCSLITDDGMLKMIEQRGKQDSLERVHLSYCTNLTIYPIYRLLDSCPRLTHLSLTAIPSFLRNDVVTYCRQPPSDFTDAQKQIFCVFSGVNVKRLKEHLTKLINTTTFLSSDLNHIVKQFIESRNLRRPEETPLQAELRIIDYIDKLTPALLSATQSSPFANLSFPMDLDIRGFQFEKTLTILSSLDLNDHDAKFSTEELNANSTNTSAVLSELLNFSVVNLIGAPGGSFQLNRQLRDIIETFVGVKNLVNDFKSNVVSFSRVRFQFAGSLIALMCHLYIMFTNLNSQIENVQNTVYNASSPPSEDFFALAFWRHTWRDLFKATLRDFYIVSLILRLIVNENLASLTRSREKALRSYHFTALNRQIQERIHEYNTLQERFANRASTNSQELLPLEDEIARVRDLESSITLLLEQQRNAESSYRINLESDITGSFTGTVDGQVPPPGLTSPFRQDPQMFNQNSDDSEYDMFNTSVHAQRQTNLTTFQRLVQNRRSALGIRDEEIAVDPEDSGSPSQAVSQELSVSAPRFSGFPANILNDRTEESDTPIEDVNME